MKLLCLYVIFGAVCNICSLFCAHLDGTSTTLYQPHHHVFYDSNNTVSGFVLFTNGFTTTAGYKQPAAAVHLDIDVPIDGPIDLHHYGNIILDNDVTFDSHVTFSSGGHLEGKNTVLTLKGDFTIPSKTTLHCIGSLIIDGNGNTLTIDEDAQLFLDNESTLTLRNMMIKTTNSYPGLSALTISSSLSSLTLDNTTLYLNDDLFINIGRFFFHNNVVVAGNHSLTFRSFMPSYVTSGSCLYLDHGVTCSFAPTSSASDLLRCQSDSSKIILNGCSIITTNTGMSLQSGTIIFKNKVDIDTFGGLSPISTNLEQTKTIGLHYPRYFDMSCDGQYIAIVGDDSVNNVRVFKKNASSIDLVASAHVVTRAINTHWSPDGKYLAVCNQYGSPTPATGFIYYFNGSSLTLVSSQEWGTYSNSQLIESEWSPDGRYIIFAGMAPTSGLGGFANRDQIRLYGFDGNSLTPITSRPYGSTAEGSWTRIHSITWSSNGKYIAVGGRFPGSAGGFNNSHKIRIYYFNGTTLEPVTSIDLGGTTVYNLAFSPDSKYLLTTPGDVSAEESRPLQLVKFENHTLTLVDATSNILCRIIGDVAKNGQTVAILADSIPGIMVYDITNEKLTECFNTSLVNADGLVLYSPSTNHILIIRCDGISSGGNISCRSFTVHWDAQTQEQSKSFFSLSNDNINQNIYTIIDGGARVEVRGHIII